MDPISHDEAAIPLLDIMASHSSRAEAPYRDDDDDAAAADQKSPAVTPTRVYPSGAEGGARDRDYSSAPPTRPYSPATVLADPDLVGLSLYDSKCVLVNREIDAMGMGRYQWYIWGLCGFGYMLDLLWAQAFGLALSPLQQELGFGNDESGNISTSFNAGLTAGAFFWGVMSDVVGTCCPVPLFPALQTGSS